MSLFIWSIALFNPPKSEATCSVSSSTACLELSQRVAIGLLQCYIYVEYAYSLVKVGLKLYQGLQQSLSGTLYIPRGINCYEQSFCHECLCNRKQLRCYIYATLPTTTPLSKSRNRPSTNEGLGPPLISSRVRSRHSFLSISQIHQYSSLPISLSCLMPHMRHPDSTVHVHLLAVVKIYRMLWVQMHPRKNRIPLSRSFFHHVYGSSLSIYKRQVQLSPICSSFATAFLLGMASRSIYSQRSWLQASSDQTDDGNG